MKYLNLFGGGCAGDGGAGTFFVKEVDEVDTSGGGALIKWFFKR